MSAAAAIVCANLLRICSQLFASQLDENRASFNPELSSFSLVIVVVLKANGVRNAAMSFTCIISWLRSFSRQFLLPSSVQEKLAVIIIVAAALLMNFFSFSISLYRFAALLLTA